MCSIRDAVAAAAVLAVGTLALTGCQLVEPVGPPPTEKINNAPLVIDEAMQQRDWDQSTAYWSNGATVAGPTGVYIRPNHNLPLLAQGAEETPLFAADVVFLPFAALIDPPWKDAVYPGVTMPASYTAAPPTNTTY